MSVSMKNQIKLLRDLWFLGKYYSLLIMHNMQYECTQQCAR